ncbi:Stk1 family PASTA domain-containing Ser/Thr kinase [Liquorilactobacillus hordei]|uniref:non-specific serine/threonine protein kinase n=2 Tax=Liquorilactobacillus hordei TaxID=468911 RepID=A0A0R1MJ11_9LACO|nr:Stk1 family PASTA domain-containing Ser/Thr kinase [Liquorilactobacillus hordei]KRL07729.1 serine threonine protein kinase [Liquorilactobacillus hordei DSM 19519]QYH52690.1 Stk1 family PASTA domain-containing Ser/Thr kinase [Liquorilactobacillus hordei DSM 19519]
MKPGYVLSGRYQIVKTLGEGGMANVYLAYDLFLKRDVAVKLMRLDLRDNEAAIRRFRREAISLTELVHSNIVSIYDIGEDNGTQFLVMEYVEGMDLKSYIAQNYPISYDQVVNIMDQVLSAVEEAHAHDIIHRDLKPQNILINADEQVKITDFGIALATSEYSLTQTNTLMGSVHYLSPEQARGSIVTKQSDIYSLGIILFELLTSRVPYEGDTAVSIALKHFQNDMPSVRAFDDQIPQALENVVLKATAKNLAERYQNVSEMKDDIETALSYTRNNEARWKPASSVEDETKVLEPLNVQQIKKNIESDNDKSVSKKDKKPKKKWSKKKKWLVWSLIAAAIIIIIIFISALAMTPKNVAVPALQGMTETEAKTALETKELSIGKIIRRNSTKYDKGQVISSNPAENSSVRENSKIDLIISRGPERGKFGNYEGQAYTKVKKKLENKGVTVVKETKTSSSVAKGEIISQNISGKKKVIWEQTTVKFTVSTGAKATVLRDLTGYTEKSVEDYADELGLVLNIENSSVSDTSTGLVISQEPAANTSVKAGDTLNIVLGSTSSSSSDSESEQSSSSSSSASSSANTFSVNVNIPYQSSSSSTSSSTSSTAGSSSMNTNTVQIYLQDDTHSYSSVYQQFTISADTSVTLPFTLSGSNTGKYKIVRDGQVIAEKTNITS